MAMQKKKENSLVKHEAFFYTFALFSMVKKRNVYNYNISNSKKHTIILPCFLQRPQHLLKPPKFTPSVQSTLESSGSFPITLSTEFFKAVPQFYFIFLPQNFKNKKKK